MEHTKTSIVQRQFSANALRYVIVTPARNEAMFIEALIQSVVAQTVAPLRWVIVNDGSTDGTEEIVHRYTREHPWIHVVHIPDRTVRHFAGKVQAFNAGLAEMKDLSYEALASLDADLTFDPKYFEFLLSKLAADSSLGVVGTPFEENGRTYDYRFVNIEHVSGACQLFRRECFDAIGGYIPMEDGGIDHAAVLIARMKGWKTRTFTEKLLHHQRKQGSANRGILRNMVRIGALDYKLGGHPLWEIFRTIYQITNPPYVIGGILIFCGYFFSMARRFPRTIPQEVVRFRQREQKERLKRFILVQNTKSEDTSERRQS